MTPTAFLQLHTNGDINFNNAININFDVSDTAPFHGTITGLTVTPTALSIDGETVDTNISAILDQITQIIFTFQVTPNYSQQFDLEILNRVFYPNAGGNSFYYFTVTPAAILTDMSSEPLPITNLDQSVSFLPFLQDIQFTSNEYNALMSNAQESRKSNLIVEADRIRGTVSPTNFEAILDQSADPAHLQDSNYSNTGWTNSRYDGSISSRDNYGGVLPSISARAFQGAVYDDDTVDDAICLGEDRIVREYVHTGPDKLPSFVTSSLQANLLVDIAEGAAALTYSVTPPLKGRIDVGDILMLENSDERMKVLDHDETTNTVQIQRGYFSEQTYHSNGNELKKVISTDIFELKDNTSNLEGVPKSKVYVLEDRSILYTDEFGLTVNQVTCSLEAYILPD